MKQLQQPAASPLPDLLPLGLDPSLPLGMVRSSMGGPMPSIPHGSFAG